MSDRPETSPRTRPELREVARPESPRRPREAALQNFWHWFAVGVLVFCWIAEASMCAARGF